MSSVVGWEVCLPWMLSKSLSQFYSVGSAQHLELSGQAQYL